jgi:hypothetical protein
VKGLADGPAKDHLYPVAGMEGSLPFITWGDADEVVGSSKVNLGEDVQVAEAIKEVRDEQKGIVVLLGDSVEALPINAEA